MTLSYGLEEVLLTSHPAIESAARIGLLTHQAAVDRAFVHGADRFAERFPDKLAALFSPQHGMWSAEQDNMIETAHTLHPRLGLPIHSLYSETRKPTAEMLTGLDLLVVDLVDVGTRVYTYIWTLQLCLQACAEQGIDVLVLDRPNPLGGEVAEGPLLDPAYRSFVGGAAIPMRHGLTMAEMARWLNRDIQARLDVVAMKGWRRDMLWADTGRAWVAPSPNLPRHEAALVYPGQVLLEGTNLSEGRGTTTPFELWGAPFVDPWRLLEVLAPLRLPGCRLRPVTFEPTFHKWQGQACGGLFVHVDTQKDFLSYRTSLAMLRAVQELWPEESRWLQPPYEYETELMPIDILTGGAQARRWISQNGDWQQLDELAGPPTDWFDSVSDAMIYPR
jgi:uncharacterized protein YbbC (DUF1343 family)